MSLLQQFQSRILILALIFQIPRVMSRSLSSKFAEDEDDDFQIVLTKADYDHLKSYEKKYSDLEKNFKSESDKHKITAKRYELLQQNYERENKANLNFYLHMRQHYVDIEGELNSLSSNKCFASPSKVLVTELDFDSSVFFDRLLAVQAELTKALQFFIEDYQHLTHEHQDLRESSKLTIQSLESKNQALQQRIDSLAKTNQINSERLQNLSHENQVAKYELAQKSEALDDLTLESQTLRSKSQASLDQNIELKETISELEAHLLTLKQSIDTQSKSAAKSKMGGSKLEKSKYVKQTLRDYARQVRKNLMEIGNLSQEEIKQLGASELNELKSFITKMEADFE